MEGPFTGVDIKCVFYFCAFLFLLTSMQLDIEQDNLFYLINANVFNFLLFGSYGPSNKAFFLLYKVMCSNYGNSALTL